MDATEQHDHNSVPFLLGTVVIGILILVLAAVLLRKPVNQGSPFDTPAPAGAASPPLR